MSFVTAFLVALGFGAGLLTVFCLSFLPIILMNIWSEHRIQKEWEAAESKGGSLDERK